MMADHAYTPDKEGYEKSLAALDSIEPVKRKNAYSKGIIVLMFLTIIWYTASNLLLLYEGKQTDAALTAAFFACFGFEFGSLAFVHNSGLKYKGGDKPHVEVKEEEDVEKTHE